MRSILGLLVLCVSAVAQDQAGARSFLQRCAACHGSDGAGGERGPDIVNSFQFRSQSPEDLRRVVERGVPDAGMPAFVLPATEMDSLLAHVGSLRAPAARNPTPGDAAAGERFFFGKGECANCHRVNGRGQGAGPDLSGVAGWRTRGHIELALHKPETLRSPEYRVLEVQLRSGARLLGYIKNESNFDLQLQDFSGKLHLIDARQIVARTPGVSVMPAVSATPAEFRDLLAYLTRLDGKGPKSTTLSVAAVKHTRGDWPTYHGQLSGNRHSSLNQINTQNAAQLTARWMFPVPNARRLETTPLVVDGIMYVTAGNQAMALDARTGRQIWRYSRPLTKGLIGDASGGINRGVAVSGDVLFMVTDHAHLLALDRSNGELLWDTEMADFRQHYGATSAPLVVKDLVLSGASGGDEGARGFIDAYRASTGERAWRFWTMPAKPGDPGSETWTGRAIEHGCALAWLTGTYDPELNLVYWTTGNPCPDYNGDERKGDNLYSDSVVALDADTGALRWHFQFTPHDLHDWDAAQTAMLVDMTWRGRPRKLLMQANRNGFFYVLDRTTGEFLLGTPFVKKLTWATGLDAKGRPVLVPGQEPTPAGTLTCPAVEGATNWMSTAWNPDTRLFYVQSLEACNIYTKSSAWWEPGKSFYGGGTRRPPNDDRKKILRAINPETGKIAWEYPQTGAAQSWGGVLSTAGGLVFFGEDSGAFAAVDAATGKALWHFQTNQLWKASPMTYEVSGEQFVAIAAGANIIAFALPPRN